jgi:hypothetical protein
LLIRVQRNYARVRISYRQQFGHQKSTTQRAGLRIEKVDGIGEGSEYRQSAGAKYRSLRGRLIGRSEVRVYVCVCKMQFSIEQAHGHTGSTEIAHYGSNHTPIGRYRKVCPQSVSKSLFCEGIVRRIPDRNGSITIIIDRRHALSIRSRDELCQDGAVLVGKQLVLVGCEIKFYVRVRATDESLAGAGYSKLVGTAVRFGN